jgi:hypothetical protein
MSECSVTLFPLVEAKLVPTHDPMSVFEEV